MRSNKLLIFFIIFLALSAFWGGYKMVKNETMGNLSSKTGSILDKFSSQESRIKNQGSDEEKRAILLSDRMVISPMNSLGGGVIYYEKNTGRVFEIPNEDTDETVISNTVLANFLSALWSPTKKTSMILTNSSSGNVFGYFDVLTGAYTELDPLIRSVTFSPDGNLIAYLKADPDTAKPSKIIVSQPDGLYPKTLMNTRLVNIKLEWPTKDQIIIRTDSSEEFSLSLEGHLTSVFNRTTGLDTVWSPSGKQILYSSFSGNDVVELVLKLRTLPSLKDTPLPASIPASNCIWSIDDINILCIVPESTISDSLYRINTFTRTVEFMADLTMPVKDILLTPSEDRLLFIGGDDRLYSIKIPD